MKKVFLDTNIVLDLLGQREGFYQPAQVLLTHLRNKGLKAIVSALTIANTHYILSERLKLKDAKNILGQFKVLVEIVPLDEDIIELALESDFNDFEDVLQYYSALTAKSDIIITRNKKDFKKSAIPLMSAREYNQLKG